MKLVTYKLNSGGGPQVGVVVDDHVINLASCGFEGDMRPC